MKLTNLLAVVVVYFASSSVVSSSYQLAANVLASDDALSFLNSSSAPAKSGVYFEVGDLQARVELRLAHLEAALARLAEDFHSFRQVKWIHNHVALSSLAYRTAAAGFLPNRCSVNHSWRQHLIEPNHAR